MRKQGVQRGVRVLGAALAAAAALTAVFPGAGRAHGDRGSENECPCCIRPRRIADALRNKRRAIQASSRNLALVGHLEMTAFNADVWAHQGIAYMGSEGTGKNAGVAVIDARSPASPRLLGRVAAIRNTTTEKVQVRRIDTPYFHGDLLAVGIQSLKAKTKSVKGIDLWDMSQPEKPRHLAFWSSGGTNQATPARGVHELFLFQQGERAYVAAMVPDAEKYDHNGDFRLVDVTNPAKPVLASVWSAFRDGHLPNVGDEYPWGHSVTVARNGKLAICSFWKAGNIFLDIADPKRPRMERHLLDATGAVGRTHSVWLSEDESVMIAGNENIDPLPGSEPWGFMRIWNIAGPAGPQLLSTFATPHATQLPALSDGIYCIHNSMVVDHTAYCSWYSDGVRAIDIANPAAPQEIASFVPENALVWGIYADGEYVYASDILSGLYILKLQ